ncbi:group III truncated hemoglobin [Thalassospira lucentensis]|uniref:group III truncated hemoglobin n=1 Tax=Thalassospira lucentensis TaxID=168935 RepID=UPI003D2EB9AF
MKPADELPPQRITELLSVFYGRVRKDPQLGPVFNDIVEDWTEHLARLEDFWSSLILTSGRYKGNPLVMHTLHSDRITPHMFDRWLEIWTATTNEMLSPDIAIIMQTKARRIASRLMAVMYEPCHGQQHVDAHP